MSKDKKVVFLKGHRIILRPIKVDTDLGLLQRWINDPDIRHFILNSFPLTIKDEVDWVERVRKSSNHIVLVIETVDGRIIGNVSLGSINWIDRTASTGAIIGDEEYRGKGIGTEAKFLLLDYAFNVLNLRKTYSEAIDGNMASIVYQLKTGGEIIGCRRKHMFKNGSYRDVVMIETFKENFQKKWEEYKKRHDL